MLISGISIVEEKDFFELRAQVQFKTHWVWGDGAFPLWYRFPRACRPFVTAENGDPFLAAFLLPAMALGETLEIEGVVSGKLLGAVPQLQSIYRTWNPELSEIQVRAKVRESVPESWPEKKGRGLFFSLGVDSSYSLWKNSKDISHLLTVQGFDVYLWESGRYPLILQHLRKVSDAFGKELIHVTTNLRDLTDRIVDWPRLHHGSALASVGLALGKMFESMHLAASTTYDLLYPWGSHPLTDPLWSSETLRFIHDGCEANRLAKVRSLSESPAILESLRVCTIDDAADVYNCGRCEKCLRTMISLHIAGALQRASSLPRRIDLESVRTMRVKVKPEKIKELIDALGSSEEDWAIKTALQDCLAGSVQPGPLP